MCRKCIMLCNFLFWQTCCRKTAQVIRVGNAHFGKFYKSFVSETAEHPHPTVNTDTHVTNSSFHDLRHHICVQQLCFQAVVVLFTRMGVWCCCVQCSGVWAMWVCVFHVTLLCGACVCVQVCCAPSTCEHTHNREHRDTRTKQHCHTKEHTHNTHAFWTRTRKPTQYMTQDTHTHFNNTRHCDWACFRPSYSVLDPSQSIYSQLRAKSNGEPVEKRRLRNVSFNSRTYVFFWHSSCIDFLVSFFVNKTWPTGRSPFRINLCSFLWIVPNGLVCDRVGREWLPIGHTKTREKTQNEDSKMQRHNYRTDFWGSFLRNFSTTMELQLFHQFADLETWFTL